MYASTPPLIWITVAGAASYVSSTTENPSLIPPSQISLFNADMALEFARYYGEFILMPCLRRKRTRTSSGNASKKITLPAAVYNY